MRLKSWMTLLLALFGPVFVTTECVAGSLQVSTTTLDVSAPASATSLQLRNTGTRTVDVQLRIFNWAQAASADQLEPTRAVVASPPFASIAPGQQFTVRIVRTDRRPVRSEESYRLLIDELPAPRTSGGMGVNFAVRYSIPVFFGPSAPSAPNLIWRAEAAAGHVKLSASNSGSHRVRLASLTMRSATGANIAERKGLVGYVLGGSSMTWSIPLTKGRPAQGPWTLTADADGGSIHAVIAPASAP
jgi:fimbrial chaperone protein